MIRQILVVMVFVVQITGCANFDTAVENTNGSGLAEQDVVSECRRHCLLNFNACKNTANSQEARNECISTYNACTRGC